MDIKFVGIEFKNQPLVDIVYKIYPHYSDMLIFDTLLKNSFEYSAKFLQ